jgi:prephenate dehydrogenase
MPFEQITIIGTGLIGGSLGMAITASGIGARIVGSDRPHILDRARKMGVLDIGIEDPVEAVRGSDLIVLATPVGAIIDLIERIGPIAAPHALITDVGSTKQEILDRARSVFGDRVSQRFLGGHPMAGKEHSSIFVAEPGLFRGATWLLVPSSPQQDFNDGRIQRYRELLELIGAKTLRIAAERHDRICAWLSHLPQMVSTALAGTLVDEFGDDPEIHAIGGRALREMTRIASSPYSMWRDIAHTNTGNIEHALAALEQRLAHLRENLRSQALREEFDRANLFELKPKKQE